VVPFVSGRIGLCQYLRFAASGWTLINPVIGSVVAKTMVSSGPQLARTGKPWTRHAVIGGPPVIGTFVGSPWAKKTIRWLSGEMKGQRDSARPRSGTASS
jgi:hypothetical protein